MLCEVCQIVLIKNQDIKFESRNGYQSFIHHVRVLDFKESAEKGCTICRTLWLGLSSEEQELLLSKYGNTTNGTTSGGDDEHIITCNILKGERISFSKPGSYIVYLELRDHIDLSQVSNKSTYTKGFFVLLPLDELEKVPLETPTSSDTSSEEVWAVATQWLDTCVHKHVRCNQYLGSEPWYPTRLLDLGPSDEKREYFRLIHTDDTAPTGPYVTLSHCWGKAHFLQLLRAKKEIFERGIPIEQLPKTFRDTVEVTRRLGIRYIWIDSLCIMQDQDDLSDWLREAMLMHKVYTYAFCNISATGAIDSSNGLFMQRDPKWLAIDEVDLKVVEMGEEKTFRTQLLDFEFWIRNMAEANINVRGWVLQERLLAPRVLHFGRDQVIWECCELDATEAFPEGLPNILKTTILTNFKNLDPATDGQRLREIAEEDNDPKFWAHALWSRIAEAYSSGLLTKEQDKMIAIAGIAKRMSSVIQDEYIAGMWRRYLASELLWQVQDLRQINNQPSKRPQKYRAPSFSWTSVDGVIIYGPATEEGMLISVKDVYLDHLTEDTTGLVRGGHLLLCGVLKRISLTRDATNRQHWNVNINGQRADPERLGETEQYLKPWVFLDVDSDDFDADNEAGTLFCMPARLPERKLLLRALIFRCMDVEQGIFQRLGLISTWDEGIQQICLARNENEASLPCRQWDGEKSLHTICVV